MIKETVSEIKKLLEEDAIEEALSRLIAELDKHNEFIVHKANIQRNTKALNLGLIEFSENSKTRSKVIYSILIKLNSINEQIEKEKASSTRSIRIESFQNARLKSYVNFQIQEIIKDLEILFPSGS